MNVFGRINELNPWLKVYGKSIFTFFVNGLAFQVYAVM